jgi:RNA:NAD 2'-phosphotransferase (TPT1/KptA family)
VNRKQLHELTRCLEFSVVHRPSAAGLTPDEEGWFPTGAVTKRLSETLGLDVTDDDVYAACNDAALVHIQTREGFIRATDRNRSRGVVYPDILYLASTSADRPAFHEQGRVSYPERSLTMHALEETAWRTAHRSYLDGPEVLYVNRQRARRGGVRFYRNKRTGLFEADHVRIEDVLNLKGDYAEQHSAGGIPVTLDADGQPRMALIQVKRRSRTTWEVAKGKLDPGETPEVAAVREVQEEMGIAVPMRIHEFVTKIRYGFYVILS